MSAYSRRQMEVEMTFKTGLWSVSAAELVRKALPPNTNVRLMRLLSQSTIVAN